MMANCVDPARRRRSGVENPATEEIIGHVPRCGSEDVRAAVGGAEQAFRPWSSTPPRERGALLAKAAGHLDGFREHIARLSSFETGNALATQSRGEARTMVDILRYFGGLAGEITGESYPPSPGRLLYTRREPLGVVGAIIPWNASLMQLASKIDPALAAGNTVVLKSARAGAAGRPACIRAAARGAARRRGKSHQRRRRGGGAPPV
jgi:acyl-CoA reductase-like NAD-dependent aldehyde dehydrogenase